MKKTLKILSWICAVVLIFGTVSVGMTAYAVSDDVIGSYDFEITNVYKDIDWDNVTAYKAETHVHTVRSDADEEVNRMIRNYYNLGYDAMALTDHGTINYGWTDDTARLAIFDYQFFVHGAVDPLGTDEYREIITGTKARTINSGKGMMEIPLGIELNGMSTVKCHVNGFYADADHGGLGLTETWPRNAVKKYYDGGGFTHINHVGEWSEGNDSTAVYTKSWLADFASIFEDYCPNRGGRDSAEQTAWVNSHKPYAGVIGMELVNTADSRTHNDRRFVYDEILELLAPKGINVFGFCEDDSHEPSDCDRNAQYFLINNTKKNDVEVTSSEYTGVGCQAIVKSQNAYRDAMYYGEFWASSKNSKNSYELGNGFNAVGEYPSVSNISVDKDKNQISVTFKDATKIRMIADGNVIETYRTGTGVNTVVFDLNKNENNINNYVRIYLTGAGGITYLQPFLLKKTKTAKSTVQFITPTDDTKINVKYASGAQNGALVEDERAFENFYYTLEPGEYEYTASRRGYQTKTESFTVTQADIDNAVQKKITVELDEISDVTYAYFYVPETIYLSPSDNITFEKYIDRENAVNGALHTDAQSTGNIFFTRQDASDIRLSYEVVPGSSTIINNITVGSTTQTSGNVIATASGSTLATSITAGSVYRALNNNEFVQIKWTLKYVYKGINYETYAYSYVYKVPMGSNSVVAAGGRSETHKGGVWQHSPMEIVATLYATGINVLDSRNSNGYRFAPYSGNTLTSTADTKVTGIGYGWDEDGSAGGSVSVTSYNSDSAYVYIDKSRVNNWSQVPYFSIGFDLNSANQETGVGGGGGDACARLAFDENVDAVRDNTYHASRELLNIDFLDKGAYTASVDYNLTDSGKPVSNSTSYFGAISESFNKISGTNLYKSDSSDSSKAIVYPLPASDTVVPVSAYIVGAKEDRTDALGLQIDLNVIVNNKDSLRAELNNTIKGGFQKEWFQTVEEWDTYQDTIARGAMLLGNPAAEKEDIDEAVEALQGAVDRFHLKTGTMTIKHCWRFNGQEGVIQTETQTFEYGQDIVATSMTITGYTYANQFVCYADGTDEIHKIKATDADHPDTLGYDLEFGDKDSFEWRFYYTPNAYNVTYNSIGADSISTFDATAYFGQDYTVAAEIPQRTGYTFGGWYLDNTMKNYSAGQTFKWNYAGNGEFAAQWTANTYNVAYDVNGGDELEIPDKYQTVHYGDTYSVYSEVPNKAGYAFMGWQLNGGDTYTAGSNISWDITSDSTLVAQWEIADFAVTFNKNAEDATLMNGSTALTDDYSIIVHYDEPYGTLPSAVRTGYDYEWYSDPNFASANKVQPTTTVSINANHTLFAKWTPVDYTITYNLNGGSAPIDNPVKYNIETGTFTLNAPVKTGYDFVGWEGTGLEEATTTVTIPTGSTGNKTFSAKWKLSDYTITYNLDGGVNDARNPASYGVGDTVVIYAPEKAGYTFEGWTGSNGSVAEKSVTIPAGSTGDKTYTANWDIITYTITYNYDGATTTPVNPSTYTVETDTFTLTNPEKFGNTFSRWICEENDTLTGKTVTITKGEVTGNLTFKADWTENGAHDIQYVLNGGRVEGSNQATYKDGNEFTLVNPTREGYTFAGWIKTAGSITEPATMEAKVLATDSTDLVFTATWNVVNYSIAYNLNNGTVDGTNPTTYNAETAKITLINPTKSGYDFTGWTGTGLTSPTETVEIKTGSTGNRSYEANWEIINYTITYYLDGGTAGDNPTGYNVESGAIPLIAPVKPGYDFTGWTNAEIASPTVSYTIPAGSIGDKTFNANWALSSYTITYVLNGGTFSGESNPNPETYSFNSGAILLINPTKTGYNFTGWDYNGAVSAQTIIPAGSSGNRTYTAIFDRAEYTITYAGIDGATVEANPATYNVDSNAITLNNPTKTGYMFEGWIGTGLSSASKNVIIANGSTGNRTYTATWTPVSYTITYNGVEGATINGTNPNSYTIETNTFTVSNPSKPGASFTGWKVGNTDEILPTVTIAKGSTGNKAYTAQWTYTDYTITYYLQGGAESTNPTTYNATSESITLKAPVRAGYTFTGWTGTGESAANLNVTIPTGSTGNRIYTANWQPINYSITYILDGGQVADNANPRTYNIESPKIILVNPVKEGCVFEGWTGTGLDEPTMEVSIPRGSTLPRTYTATWSDDNYTITYSGIEGATFTGENRISYTVATNDFTLNNPSKRGYHFDGWSGTEISGSGISTTVTVPKGSSGDRSYTANWTLENYTVTYDFAGGTEGGIKNPTRYTILSAPFTLYAPTKTGYEFAGWEGSYYEGTEATVTVDPSEITGDLSFTAVWATGSYVITLDPKGGTLPAGQSSTINYTYDTPTFTIQNPERAGYTFAGWTGTGISGKVENLVISQGSTGSRSYVANWMSSNENNITYNLDGGEVLNGTNPESYVTDSGTITLITPTKAGYKFAGWEVEHESTDGIVTFKNDNPKSAIINTIGGSAMITAKWTPSEYRIKYNLNGGTATDNPATYTIETPAFTLNNPVRPGYTFGGWIGTDLDDSKANTAVSISAMTGNRTYTALWTEEDYSITYNYNGGSSSDPNPVSYTVATPTFTLNNPVKAGYTFIGWTGSNGSTPQKTVTIAAGTTGAKNYTANFSSDTFTIKYIDVDKAEETYTVDSPDINIENPVKTGYYFLGWMYDGAINPVKNLVIRHGSTGNKVLTAKWQATDYTISYELNGGTVSGTNPESYTIESAAIQLANPTKDGYVFTGWSGTDIDGLSSGVTIAKGSTGNRSYTANWDIAPFTISYSGLLTGAVQEQSLPTEYSANEAVVIRNPVMPGYRFAGWTGTGLTAATKDLVIPQGSTGNRIYKATWTIEEYSITVELAGGTVSESIPTNYNIGSADIVLPTPRKTGYAFAGWTGTELSAPTKNVVIPSGSVNDRTYTATWTERTSDTHRIYFRGYKDVPLYVDIKTGADGKVYEHNDYVEVAIDQKITDEINPLVLHPEKIDTTAGYKITGWDIDFNADEYTSCCDDITVHAICDVGDDIYTVQVNGTRAYTEQHGQFEKVTVTTDYANASGELFSHWIANEVDDNGNIIPGSGQEITSFYRNYTFYVHANVVLIAVYGQYTPVRATTRISKIEPYDPNYDWFTPNSERSVATELTMTQHGIIFTAGSAGQSDSSFVIGGTGVYCRASSTKGLTGTWALSIKNPNALGFRTTIYVRSYVIVADEDGNKTTKYSAIRTYTNDEDITADAKEGA